MIICLLLTALSKRSPVHHLSFEFTHGVFLHVEIFYTHTHTSPPRVSLFPFGVLSFLFSLKQSPPPPPTPPMTRFCSCPVLLVLSISIFHTIYLYKELLRTLPNGMADVCKPPISSGHCVWARCARRPHHPPMQLTWNALWAEKQWKNIKTQSISTSRPGGSF